MGQKKARNTRMSKPHLPEGPRSTKNAGKKRVMPLAFYRGQKKRPLGSQKKNEEKNNRKALKTFKEGFPDLRVNKLDKESPKQEKL